MRLLDICQNTNCLKMIIKLYFAAKFTFFDGNMNYKYSTDKQIGDYKMKLKKSVKFIANVK